MVLTEDVRLALDRLCQQDGRTQAATVARLIITADEGMIQSFLDDKCGMDRYMGRDTSQEDP
ncbi:MAG: hypothetical protein ACYDBP_13680 [Leptospirales bacterium]